MTLTVADFDNGKIDLETVDAVANSKDPNTGAPADTWQTRRGDQTDTVQGRLSKLGVIFDDPIRDYAAGLLIEDLRAHRYPAGTGDIYIPKAPLPFTTGAVFDADSWAVYNSKAANANLITFYSVDAMKSGTASNGDLVDPAHILASDIGVQTYGHNGGWAVLNKPTGGAEYILTTLQNVRDTKGDPTWEPDGFADHYLYNGVTFVAMLTENIVTPEMLGANGDGVDDDSDFIEVAFGLEKKLRLTAGAEYRISREVVITDKNVSLLDSPNAKLNFFSEDSRVIFDYPYSELIGVISVDNSASIDMSNGTSATETPCTKLTLPSASGYSAGDTVKIISDDTLNGTDPSANERLGEHAIVFEIVGNELYLDRVLRQNNGGYSTNVRVAKASAKSCSLGSFNIDGLSGEKVTRNISHVMVQGCAHANFRGTIKSNNTQATSVEVRSCCSPQGARFEMYDGVTDSSVGAFAHGILNTCGTTDFNYDEIFGRNMRHLCDTTAIGVDAGSLDIHLFGGVTGGFVGKILGVGMQAQPASTHSDADNIRFGQVVSMNPIQGPNGFAGCVGFRGRNCHVDYADCDNGTALYAFNDFDDPDNSRGHSAGKIIVRDRGLWNRARAFFISGASALSSVDVKIDEIQWSSLNNNSISSIGVSENAVVSVGSVTASGEHSGTVDLFDINSNSKVEIGKLVGRGLGGFTLSDVEGGTCEFRAETIDIETNGASWGYLVNMNNADAKIRIGTANIDTDGSASDLILNRGASADIVADWVIGESENTAVRNRKRMATIAANAATSYDIDVLDIGAPLLYQRFSTTFAGASVGNITDGLFLGQEIIISNHASSTEDLSVPDNPSGLRVVGTITLEPKQAVRGYWTGFEWVLGS